MKTNVDIEVGNNYYLDIEKNVKMDIDTDVLIFLDNDKGLTASEQHIMASKFDTATKDYYLRIIRSKEILKQLLSPQEKLVLTEYFYYNTNLAWSKRYYKDYLSIGDKQQDYQKLLTDAAFKFIVYVDILPQISPTALMSSVKEASELFENNIKNSADCELKLLYQKFLRFNTYKNNVNRICTFKKSEAAYFVRLRSLIIAYMNFEYRAKQKLYLPDQSTN